MIDSYSAEQIITAKRDGQKLTSKQVNWFVQGLLKGEVQDFQASALLMAIYLNGCDKEETSSLTNAMLNSGTILNFNDPKVIDKHSTGGVGDKTSLILGPIAAAAGVKVPMISGRGLGHTGGTIDKMEAIPGFHTSLSTQDFIQIVNTTGIAIIAQSSDLAPADKIIYNLRNLTGTVASIPLITSSIMSKKLAEGTSGLVLDIKVGKGAFMKSTDEARALAKSLRETTTTFGKNIITMLTDMSQPLGEAIGNSNEVIESIEVLKGRGPEDVKNLSIELAAAMIFLAKIAPSMESARELALVQISSGNALFKFQEMIKAQGGDPRVIEDYGLLAVAPVETKVLATQDGYVTSIDVLQLGVSVQLLGGGRKNPQDLVDHSVGVLNLVKIGSKVMRGDVLAIIQHHQHQQAEASQMLLESYVIKKEKPAIIPDLIQEVDYEWAKK